MKSEYPRSRKENIVVQELDGEVLVYDLSDNKAFCLNETSALVWELCDGDKSVAEISQSIGKKLNSPANEDLVWLALDQLKKEQLLENSEEVIINFNGLNRREVIKKVGLASLVAIPVIMSITSPVAAASTSVCGNNTQQFCSCPVSVLTCFGNTGAPAGGVTPCAGSGFAGFTTNCQANGQGANATCMCNGPFVCTGTAGFARGVCS